MLHLQGRGCSGSLVMFGFEIDICDVGYGWEGECLA